MNDNLKFYIIYSFLYGIILLIGEVLYRFLKVNPALTRNFSHLAAGLVSLPFPWIFTSHWWVLLIAVQSSLILFITRYAGLLPSHHLVAVKSAGSSLFFASLYLCFLGSFYSGITAFFTIPILVMTICDLLAAVIGRNFGTKPNRFKNWTVKRSKTREGTVAFLLSSFGILIIAYLFVLKVDFFHAFLISVAISVAAAVTEALSPNGFDNFSVPVITLFIMWLINYL